LNALAQALSHLLAVCDSALELVLVHFLVGKFRLEIQRSRLQPSERVAAL